MKRNVTLRPGRNEGFQPKCVMAAVGARAN